MHSFDCFGDIHQMIEISTLKYFNRLNLNSLQLLVDILNMKEGEREKGREREKEKDKYL